MSSSTQAYWRQLNQPRFPALDRSQATEVCVIGAGIAGLTIAYQLLQKGIKVVVLERREVGSGESGLSSAHLSDALDDGFQALQRMFGSHGLQQALLSHRWAIDEIERIQNFEHIQCGFERLDGFLVLGESSKDDYLEQEYSALSDAGWTDARLLNQEAPFQFGDAIHFPRQAQFHPLAYLYGLARAVRRLGGLIYTSSPVVDIEEGATAIVHSNGFHILAEHLVIATNVPFNNRFKIHSKLRPMRTYVVALKVAHGVMPPLLLWDTDDPYHYVRLIHENGWDYDLLLVGGEDHKTGQEQHPEECYDRLRSWIGRRMKIHAPTLYQWSGQIIEPMDSLGYIGRNPGSEKNTYIVTGDSGHGLTHGTIAGKIITDQILGQSSAWEQLYNPSRAHWRGDGELISNNLNVAAQYLDWITPGEKGDEKDIAVGEGAILRSGTKKIAVYRENETTYHRLNATCPHLQCIVHWNSAEKTWDCPCHGSRFTRVGAVLNGPAHSGLAVDDTIHEPKEEYGNSEMRQLRQSLRSNDADSLSGRGPEL